MNNNTTHPSEDVIQSVRLIGIGQGGGALVAKLFRGAEGPLADLLGSAPDALLPSGEPFEADTFDLANIAILFIAVALDGNEAEIRSALFLAWRACAMDIRVISIVVHSGPDIGPSTNADIADFAEALADELIDGQIDVAADASDKDLDALRWFYGGLRSLARQGMLILEPGWDLTDIVEVLGLPHARLSLATRSVSKGVSILVAVADALEDLAYNGTDLELASGILIVLWRAPDQTLYVRDVREVARMAGSAVGQGGLHLTLTARSKVAWGAVGSCATVVASTPSDDAFGDQP